MRFSMLYSGEQFLSFKSCLVFYAGDSLINVYSHRSGADNPRGPGDKILMATETSCHLDHLLQV